MQTLTITRLSDLLPGDRITRLGSIDHTRKPLRVMRRLEPVPGTTVEGVYVGRLAGGVEFYLYPSQCDGQEMEVQR